MSQVVIATNANRATRLYRTAKQKFAQVRRDGKFQFVTNINEATVFQSFAAALKAYGIRCQKLRREPTGDLVFHEVAGAGVRTLRVLNGG